MCKDALGGGPEAGSDVQELTADMMLKHHLSTARRRWECGIKAFHEKLDAFKASDRGQAKVIRTALYGDVVLESDELLFLDSFYLQRLRGVSQLGMQHVVYPDARHTRFDHSIGVLTVAKKMVEALDLPRKEARAVRYAALLHDIGHGPFSHTSEQVFDMYDLDSAVRGELLDLGKQASEFPSKYHERKAEQMLTDTDDVGQDLLGLPSYGIAEALASLEVDPGEVAAFVSGTKKTYCSELINGPLDADKFDYFQRDAFHTGYTPGGIDSDFIIRAMRVVDQRLCIDAKAVPAVLRFLTGRPITYHATAFHPVVRVANSMILAAVDLAMDLLAPRQQVDFLLHLDLLDDADLLHVLGDLASFSSQTESKHLRAVLDRLRNRSLLKKNRLPVGETCRKAINHSETPLDDLARRESKRMWFHAMPDGEVRLLDLSFEVKSKAAVKAALEGIMVSSRGSRPTSLYEHLRLQVGESADHVVNMLYTAPMFYGCAVVASPDRDGLPSAMEALFNSSVPRRPKRSRMYDLRADVLGRRHTADSERDEPGSRQDEKQLN